MSTDRFQKRKAIHDGHHQIEQDQIGRPLPEFVERFAAVGGSLRFESAQLEEPGHGLATIGLIIDNQDTLHTARTRVALV